jgi:hypothetical protein
MMMFKFHINVKTEGTVAVGSSAVLGVMEKGLDKNDSDNLSIAGR